MLVIPQVALPRASVSVGRGLSLKKHDSAVEKRAPRCSEVRSGFHPGPSLTTRGLEESLILSVPLFSRVYNGDKNLPLGFVVRFVKGNVCEDLGTTSDTY